MDADAIQYMFNVQRSTKQIKMNVNSEFASALFEKIAKLDNDAEKVTLIAGMDGQR